MLLRWTSVPLAQSQRHSRGPQREIFAPPGGFALGRPDVVAAVDVRIALAFGASGGGLEGHLVISADATAPADVDPARAITISQRDLLSVSFRLKLSLYQFLCCNQSFSLDEHDLISIEHPPFAMFAYEFLRCRKITAAWHCLAIGPFRSATRPNGAPCVHHSGSITWAADASRSRCCSRCVIVAHSLQFLAHLHVPHSMTTQAFSKKKRLTF